jgi:hypothetical protein
MTDLRTAAQQALEALEAIDEDPHGTHSFPALSNDAITALRAALAQQEATGKESLQVPQHIADQLTTADLAWLETRRLVRLWKELGQMIWMGEDEGWNLAIGAVRTRLDKECQDVLAWKSKVDASGETAKQVLQRMRGERDE